jgi:hypothetical protein
MEASTDSHVSRRVTSNRTEPDYLQWAQRDYWSLAEACKLICGRNPHSRIPSPQLYNRQTRVIDLIDLAFAAVQASELKIIRNSPLPVHVMVEPVTFLRWATDKGYYVPTQLMRFVECTPEQALSVRDTLQKELICTVVKTLVIVAPDLSIEEIANHRCMHLLADDLELRSSERFLVWIQEARNFAKSLLEKRELC